MHITAELKAYWLSCCLMLYMLLVMLLFHYLLCPYLLLAVLPLALCLSSPFPICFIAYHFVLLQIQVYLACHLSALFCLSSPHFWVSPLQIWGWMWHVTQFRLWCILSSSLWSCNNSLCGLLICALSSICASMVLHLCGVPLHLILWSCW